MDPITDRLAARHPRVIDLSLDRMRALLAALGNPERRLPPVVHVAGTNGKGSTVAFLRAMAEAAGLRVHVSTSPHLVRFHERIRLAGRLIDDAALERALRRVEAVDAPATVFEAATAVAFLAMAEVPADLCLLEVGLGGRFDATSVIERPALCVITPVDLDHAEYLGADLAGIAREKAGILKPGVAAVIARQPEPALAAIAAEAERVGAPLSVMGTEFDAWAERGGLAWQGEDRLLDLPAPALAGPHQVDNAGLATAAAVALGLGEAAIAEGLRTVRWPARLQRLTAGPYAEPARAAGAELWLDGGHNPHAGRALAEALGRMPARPTALVVGMLANKDAAGFLAPLAALGPKAFSVAFEGAAAPPEALAATARGLGLAAEAAPGVAAAIRAALAGGAGRVVICGSLYLAGEVLGADRATWPD